MSENNNDRQFEELGTGEEQNGISQQNEGFHNSEEITRMNSEEYANSRQQDNQTIGEYASETMLPIN